MHTDSSPQVVPYGTLLSALNSSMDGLVHASFLARRMRALFEAIKSEADLGSHIETLADIGLGIAAGAERDTNENHETASDVREKAGAALPKREWRTCGFPAQPSAEELAQEQVFAIAVTGFPKMDSDGAAVLRCILDETIGDGHE